MSNFTMERICCPECRTEQNTKVWEEINAKTSPKAKAEILEGNFFEYECKKCGHKINMTYNCIYHDLENGIVIWLIPELQGKECKELNEVIEKDIAKLEKKANEESASEEKLFRLVSTPNQLREKLLIAEQGMDDRIVEIMKKIYLANLHMFFPEDNVKKEDINEVLFDVNKEKNRGVVLFTKKYEPIFLPVNDKMYEKVKEDFIEAVNEFDKKGFEKVDSEWADQYIAIEE